MKELESLGLTPREIDTYLALLELGSNTVGAIVKKSKVPSSKIYEVLGKLIDKGLVSFIIKGKTKYFQASEPESLVDILDEKKKKLEQIIPLLKKKQNREEKEQVSLFEGDEGMKTALRKVLRTLKPGDDYYVYIPPTENMNSENSKTFFNNFNLRRKEAKIKTKLLIHKDQKKVIEAEYKTLNRKQIKFTDFSFPSRLGIYKNHVLIINHKKKTSAVLIQSPETYKIYKEFFLNMWEAKRE